MLNIQNHHPRDSSIKFDELPHIYYVNDKKVDTSVTKLVHSFFSGFNANQIASRCIQKAKKDKTSPYVNMTKDEILQQWENNRDQSANAGTFLHKTIENFYNKKDYENNSREFEYFLNFYNKTKNKLVPYRTEWEIYHEELNLAGSIDMVFQNVETNRFVIFDWKRSKEIKKISKNFGKHPVDHLPDCNFWHYSLQLNMYKYILESKYDVNIDDMNLLVLHPDEFSFRQLNVPNLQNEIMQMVELRKNHLNNIVIIQ